MKINKNQINILEKRKVQEEIIITIYKEMVLTLGKKKAEQILEKAIINSAIYEGESLRKIIDRKNNKLSLIDKFIEVFDNWKIGGALKINEIKKNEEVFHFDVTRCKYAEMYKEMGIKELGSILSCNRDNYFSKGFDNKLSLKRKQTIMNGDKSCTFRYKIEKN